jgi:hypothetical protein
MNDQIARIDVVLSRGFVKHLLESSIVNTLLKVHILVRDEFKNCESPHFY